MIPYGRQNLDEDDIEAVLAVLRGDWLTQGPAVDAFEARICELTGAAHAVAFTSGTAALHGAAFAARFGAGDVVATSPLTFSASAACARYVGATPTLVDIDPTTLNLDVGRVPEGLAGVVAVDYAGLPADLSQLAGHPAVVIRDAAHSLGAITPQGPVGNNAQSHMTTFSFHPVKPITTAEGGAVTTNDPELDHRLRLFRNHGMEKRPERGGWYYEIVELGVNYRLSDLHAALGLAQLDKLEPFIVRRNALADRYRTLLADLPVELPPAAPPGVRHGYHLFPIRVAERARVFAGLRDAGIGVQVHYVPIHHHPAYADLGFGPGDLPHADAAYERLISIPMHPGLTDDEQDRVVAVLADLTT